MNCNIEKNIKNCNCTYLCVRKGKCCDCISYHRGLGELPACYFSSAYERSYDRTVENYLKSIGKR
ncbi:MAG: hypothetical protein GW876_09730 [Bacteroidetes bacterium]|nr:hypothetical protein [Bacteroidota bacterium]